ncbi:MAG: glycosyltransferase family 2 protein [Rhodospirillales bacterium]|jgi:glycosyltransferase involved in cell wall biosynthesis|nr:glycosyltransferase family 2 protein [Rhodospirillales bacterium]MDP7651745.1 glycosyltransferase family 2 protein [Rhodospirillales bacterium]
MSQPLLSALVVVHNEEVRLDACLERLAFADELVVVLDKCTDGSREIAERYTDRILDGAWEIEGDRRNTGIEFCAGEWILEVDADEWVTDALAGEIRRVVESTSFDWHEILVDNYIGDRLVRWGWGASYGKAAYPGLFRKGVKVWGRQRVHPALQWSGRKGPMLKERIDHHVDRGISDMIRRLDSYSTARARDLRDSGEIGTMPRNLRRLFSRFFKCYVSRKGYREGGYGLLIAIFAGLYPLLSHLKAKLEQD